VLVVALALAAGAVALAISLHPSAAPSTLVSSSSHDYKATQSYYRDFGEEPIEVLVRGNLQKLVLSPDLERLLGLEGCLSGNVPAAALGTVRGASGPCGQLAAAHTVKVVLGPGTFVNEAAGEIDEQLANQTKRARRRPRAAHEFQPAARPRARAARARALGRQAHKI
jgi:hypothetical protein